MKRNRNEMLIEIVAALNSEPMKICDLLYKTKINVPSLHLFLKELEKKQFVQIQRLPMHPFQNRRALSQNPAVTPNKHRVLITRTERGAELVKAWRVVEEFLK